MKTQPLVDSAAGGRREDRALGKLMVFAVDDQGSSAHPLPDQPSAVVGRGAGRDVSLEGLSISRRHLVIHRDPLAVEDLGSINGTFVKQHRLEPGRRVPVDLGEPIRVGDAHLIIQREQGHAATARRQRHPPTLTATLPEPSRCLVSSLTMRKIDQRFEKLASDSEHPILLMGETGVGKDVVAEHIHRISPRAGGKIRQFNCANFNKDLMESQLFGHERSAFTGASSSKVGMMEEASGGTFVFDEIGELPLELQPKLLKFLDKKEVWPVGANSPRKVDVRLIFSTNRSLSREVAAGRFRSDLYFRLGEPFVIPPLRERLDELEHLVALFIAAKGRSPSPVLAPETLDLLREYRWPGNIRQLQSVIQAAVCCCEGPLIRPEHIRLPEYSDEQGSTVVRPGPSHGPLPDNLPGPGGLNEQVEALERKVILEALHKFNWNKKRTAAYLGITRNTLQAKIDKYRLKREPN